MVQALNTALAQSQLAHTKASEVLATLKPMDVFCNEELTKLLKEKWKVDVDVERDTLDIVEKFAAGTGVLPFGYESYITTTPSSLLHAAMENFTSAQALSGGIPGDSLIKINAHPQTAPEITPTKFAALCRDLDLGNRYQRHIFEVLAPPATTTGNGVAGAAATATDILRLKRLDMQVAAHMAYLKKDISRAAYTTLLKIIEQDVPAAQVKDALLDDAPLIWQGVMIHDICLVGALVFSKVSIDTETKAKCLVYMPNEPRRPFYEYASLDEFKVYLALHLQSASYRKRFTELFLFGNDKIDFFSHFDKDKVVGTLKALPANASVAYFLYSAFVSKTQKDARILAVPTADVDEQQREKTLQLLLDGGLLLLNAAAFFVPVLGQLMLVTAAFDIVSEVYEGVVDWTHGERNEALTHLLTVVENVAQMAAFAAGGKVVSALSKSVKEQVAFYDGFEAVTRADGNTRLWKPDLEPYKQTSTLPADVTPDSQGLYRHAGHTSIVMDGAPYRVARKSAESAWTINHPLRTEAFQPAVEQNVEGGWRHVHEHAHEWHDAGYALERASPRLSDLDVDLEPFADITELSTDTLHHMHESNLKLPQRLNDCLERYTLDQSITEMIAAMERAETENTDFLQEQLHTLPRLPGWPEDRFIEVRDEKNLVLSRFPETAPHNDDINSVHVSQKQLDSGELLDTVISGLYPQEVEGMIGSTITIKESKSHLLAKKIAASLKSNRQPLRDWLYKNHDGTATGDVAALHEKAPDLPTRVCQELLENASCRDRSFLRERKLLGIDLTRQVNEARAAIRRDRALTGLRFPQLANADSDRLALGLMDRVQGWNDGSRLELREGSATGTLLDSVGAADSLSPDVIVKTTSGYQVNRSVGKVSSTLKSETLPQAILDALPATRRTGMGLTGEDALDIATLRARLTRAGAGDPEHTGRLLRGERIDKANYLSACVQADPPAPGSYSRALIRRVRKLYPQFTDLQVSSFLDEAGTTLTLRVNRIRELERQLKTFLGVLRTWREDEVEMNKLPGPLNDIRVNRRQVANVLENCWRRVAHPRWPRGKPVDTLTLERNPSGQLPTLSEQDVAHVRNLSIKHMEAGDKLAYFLRPFKGLVSLELDNNQLTRLPEAVSLMPNLEHLRLDGNQLQLTEHTLRKLTAMSNLRTLGLSGNQLGATVDVSKMLDLKELFLSDTHATELPVGLARLTHLDIADLRNNQIQVLPDWLFQKPRQFVEAIDLTGNTLAAVSLAKVQAYYDRTSIGMGLLKTKSAVALTEQRARDLWMSKSAEENYASRNRTWVALKNEPDSIGFFRLLADIGGTKDNIHWHEEMTRRVWSVIDATQTDGALRDQLLAMAVRANCDDAAATIFSNLEVAVDLDTVVRQAANAHEKAALLLQLGKRSFRLDYLTKIAGEKALADKTLDPVQVELAYRIQLAESLKLVGQPKAMHRQDLGKVTQADLTNATTRITAAELSPELSNYISGRTFWRDFLREHFASKFTALAAPFHVRLEAATERHEQRKKPAAEGEKPLVDGDKMPAETEQTLAEHYRTEADAIGDELKIAEADLFTDLTKTFIQADALGVCFAFD
ncbi:NEL-type E3 ubiquitin ligase domain-containing protein [Pseudomonas fluorescens]|uniref:NEL-type E3 ubiquitin ligase domain-containing protein n=1 Tax=Pseudomonas fluorescens TaxID=294 RepID=UPI001CD3FC4C|nr:NEL-type E3 ubiquitin ligase domain-containing protein [Pseudomonas fluorescens]